ncbi:MAG: plastocyanin/azurin family copper-binding protein [Verrucomicrobiota bacterium]
MFPTKYFPLCLASISLAAISFAQEGTPVPKQETVSKPSSKSVTFEVLMRDGLRFEPARLSANPGDEITIRLENADTTHQTHNFVLLKPGKLKEIVNLAMELEEKGPGQNFVPVSPDVLAQTIVLDPDKQATVKFKLPAEPGIYPYVCTFPGHGMVMYGALYSGIKPPPLEKDPNIPPTVLQSMIAGNGRRPFLQRVFMPEAGPAAIAVALPGTQNFCWDSGQCRLRYAWQGGFIDASGHWKGNGHDLARLPSVPWWNAPADAFPIRFGSADAEAPSVRFLGYRLAEGIPEFHFKAGQAEIFEKIGPGEKEGSIVLHYRIPKAENAVVYKTAGSDRAKWSSSKGELKDGLLTLTAQEATDFTLTLTDASQNN